MELALPTSASCSRSHRLTWGWQVSLLAALYVFTGALGLQLAHYQEGVTLVWAPTGLSLAALILFGQRLWPGVFVGALLVNLFNSSANLPSALVIAIGNTLEAVVGVALLTRVTGFRPSLERMQDGIAFLLIGVLGCTTISATIGVTAYYVFGFVDAAGRASLWLTWWLGDLGGALILTPLLLMLVHGTPSWTNLARRVETWLAFGLLLSTSLFAFFNPVVGVLSFAAFVPPVSVLIWAGIRLGPRGATLASFFMILIGTIASATGSGPFALATPAETMLLTWNGAVLIGFISFTLAAVVEQRNLADQRHRLEETARLGTEKQKLLLLERERLTREMHDGLGAQLVSVLAMVERGVAAPSEVAESLRRVLDDTRIVIDSLDPENTDLPASLGRLRASLEPLLRRNQITLNWYVDNHLDPHVLAPNDVLHVLRIIQEAVINTLRHANASNIEVVVALVEPERKRLHLTIRDDGCGLPADGAAIGRGIRSMNSRAEELGAEIRIKDTGSGTQIDLTSGHAH